MANNTVRVERSEEVQGSGAQALREVMDIRMAADYLGISTDSLYRYAAEGTLPGFRLGNRWRFKKSRLDEWMDEQSGSAKTAPSARAAQGARKPVRSAR